MAVRKVVTRRSRNVRGYMPSLKMGRAVAWESQNELKLLRLLELSGSVVEYDVQPSVEIIEVAGIKQIYIPDVQVRYDDGQIVTLEVKPVNRLMNSKVAARMEAFKNQCEENNRKFYIITDIQLEAEPRTKNCEELMYHRRQISKRNRYDLEKQVNAANPKTIEDLIDLIGKQLSDVALGSGIVGINIDFPIERRTEIRLCGGHHYAHLHP